MASADAPARGAGDQAETVRRESLQTENFGAENVVATLGVHQPRADNAVDGLGAVPAGPGLIPAAEFQADAEAFAESSRILDRRVPPQPQASAQPAPERSAPAGNAASANWGAGLETGKDILAALQLGKTYGKRQVVKDVSLNVRRGEAVGLLGANGAGKTTAFYMITGLVNADKGAIILDGQDITHLPMYRRARLGIGYLPQEASIFRGLTVENNIRAVLEVVERDKRRRETELDGLLEEFNIARLRKAPSIALSGGERRRVEIARALAGRPSFMLLDEPFAGIDPIAVGDIQALVRHLTRRGIGVLITDHNVRETLGLVDRAYIMHSGQLLMEGSPDDVIANEDVRRSYLGQDFRL